MKNKITAKDTILIAGGSGFIGRRLAERCLKLTPNVTCLGAPNDRCDLKGVKLLRVDIRSAEDVSKALSGKRFNYVFNLSGYIDHRPYFDGGRAVIDTHLAGLMNIVSCLDRSALKGFVQVGSSDEYGDAPAPQEESIRESPISPYSFSKAAATYFVTMLSRIEKFPGVVLRFFLVYGPGQDDRRFLPQIIKACLNNEKFKTSEGIQARDFCYIDDVVEAMVMAAVSVKARGHIINVASGKPVLIRDMVKKVIRIAGGGMPLWGAYPYKNGENMKLYADISLAGSILGWRPRVTLEEGLKATIDYYSKIRK
ncbi:MAG: NAD-dependent epimerase/dehydratase family protein [Candidatus Omnitrophica bacterium]|nr:NAD-dependent epimerase/dehydratase family protein [Candidatus Omnitrophota bacterium]